MSDEPRLRLERNGVVVSEYWYDNSTGETVVESESGETYRFTGDGTIDTPALKTSELSGVKDHIVRTTSELESAFDNLQAGDVVYITGVGAPYRTTQWLDIDVDNVTVIGTGEEGLVTSADGSDVGGIRVGNTGAPRNIKIFGFGHDGNYQNMDPAVKDLDSIQVNDFTGRIEIAHCDLRRQSPHHEHGTGGTGVSIAAGASGDIALVHNNYIVDPGDRGIETFGCSLIASENFVGPGYDRAINVETFGDQWCIVSDNYAYDLADGSAYGHQKKGDAYSDHLGAVNFVGNLAHGEHNSVVTVRSLAEEVNIVGNVGYNVDDNDGTRKEGIRVSTSELQNGTGEPREVNVVGNHVSTYATGLALWTPQSVNAVGNLTSECTRGIVIKSAGKVVARGNYVDRTTGNGIDIEDSSGNVVAGNRVQEAGGRGIIINGPANTISGNYIDTTDLEGILVNSGENIIEDNIVLRAGSQGIKNGGGTNEILSNNVKESQSQGIQLNSGTGIAIDNILESNGQTDSGTPPEMVITGGSGHIVIGTQFVSPTNGVVFQNADTTVFADNRAPTTESFNLDSSILGAVYDNRPAVPVDVTTLTDPTEGDTSYNNGTVGTLGPAFYDGSAWVSLVDGTTIN